MMILLPAPVVEGARYWQLPVGHGDLALVDRGDHRVVIDTGPSPRRLESQLLPLLRQKPPDLIIVSHEHPDHLGGISALCRRFPGVPLRLPEPPQSKAALRALQACRQPAFGHGWTQRLGGLHLDALPPPDDWVRGVNDRSLAVALETENQRWLFLGDIEADRELDLMGRLGEADGVKVPHHGSRTSSTSALIEETSAQWAVFTAGRDDPYGHPHRPVEERWAEAGAHLLPTTDRPVCLLLRAGRATRPCPELAFLRPGPLIASHGTSPSQPQFNGSAKGGLGRQW